MFPWFFFTVACCSKIEDIAANLLSEVCKDVSVKPPLPPSSGDWLSYIFSNSDNSACLARHLGTKVLRVTEI